MQTSAFEYKCRRCGFVYEVEILQEDWLFDVIREGRDVVKESNREEDAPIADIYKMHDIHACLGRGHGISDLIGLTPPREEGE